MGERWREIPCHDDDETGAQVPAKRLVLHHFPHSPFVQGLRAKCHYNCRSACMRVAGWWVHVAARHGPVNQLWLRVDFKEAEVGLYTIARQFSDTSSSWRESLPPLLAQQPSVSVCRLRLAMCQQPFRRLGVYMLSQGGVCAC